MKYLFLFSLCLYGVLAKHEIYDGHAVYEVDVKNVDEINLINELENELYLDVWSHALPGRPGQILVPKIKREPFENALKDAGLQYTVQVENIKELLEKEDQLLARAASRANKTRRIGLSFDEIHTYETVDAYLEELASVYPDVVTLVVGGRSIQGRPIKYLRISTTNFQETRKPVVMMQSLLHSREWVSLPVTLYAIEKLVIDVTESDLVQNIDWIILPVANPDGYVWTHTNARFWRKNRATGYMIGDFCSGVDLNRNFNINWGTASGNSPCLDTFHGRSAFSEPETAVIRDIFNEHGWRMVMFLDIHSFGSLLLFGYGNGVLPANGLVLNMVGVEMAQTIDRIKWPSNPDYTVGNVALILYSASGSASDFGSSIGVPLSYTYELPAYRNNENSLDGFLVDPDFIEQAGYETWEGIKVGVRAAVSLYGNRNSV